MPLPKIPLLNLFAWADLKHQSNLSEVRLADTEITDFLEQVQQHLLDDLATSQALAEVYQYVTKLAPGMTLDNDDFDTLLSGLDKLLGLNLDNRPDITSAQKHIIAERETAREARNWAAADKLRTELRRHDLDVSDTPNGPRWRRTKI
ncbi:hypothetical protein IPG36_04905 [bacterium]|nr:MAG: hypothetical protein IPG36_04905 [bacterium]